MGRPSRRRAKHRSRARLALRIVVAVVVVLVVACAGAFSAFRWLYGNDEADIQGTWYVAGTDTPIVVTEDAIEITDEVAYVYFLNPESKTYAIVFGTMQGAGRYRFSLDRQELALMDGSYGWWSTLASDVSWTVRALGAAAAGDDLAPDDSGAPDGQEGAESQEGGGAAILLSRVSASEQAAAEQAVAGEELEETLDDGGQSTFEMPSDV